MSLKPGQTIHMCITKEKVIEDIKRLGPQQVLKDAAGMTVGDAIGFIESDGREVFVMTADCDNYDARGYCQGHPTMVEVDESEDDE